MPKALSLIGISGSRVGQSTVFTDRSTVIGSDAQCRVVMRDRQILPRHAEVRVALEAWEQFGCDIAAWQTFLNDPPKPQRADIWTPMEHAPGFDPHGVGCATPVLQTLQALAALAAGPHLPWLAEHRLALEAAAKAPLAMSGVAAAAFRDLGLNAEQGEMLYLLLRLPGAAAHALEQKHFGFKRFPFFHGAVKYVGARADNP